MFTDQLNEELEEELYLKVKNADVSYQAEQAVLDYFQIIEPLCMKYPELTPSFLRFLIRPIFYMGYCSPEEVYSILEAVSTDNKTFHAWITLHQNSIYQCIRELYLCSVFYGLDYSEEKNCVLLNLGGDEEFQQILPFNQRQEKGLWNDSFREFHDYEEFQDFFYRCFGQTRLSKKDINRIMTEEDYVDYFEQIKPV